MSEVKNVASYLAQAAEANPHQLAVVEPKESKRFSSGRKLTFQELHQLACGYASGLSKKGIAPGMRTLVVVKPGLDLLGLVFSLFKIGAIPILIDPGMGRKNLLKCIERSKPKALVGIPLAHGLSRLFPKAFKDVSVRIPVGSSLKRQSMGPQIQGDYQTWEKDYQPDEQDLAAILFTSGSTGAPKGVCYRHSHFLAQLHYLKTYFDIQAGEVDFPMLPVFALFAPALGTTMVLPPLNPSKPSKANIAKVVSVMLKQKVTLSFGSPVLWKLITKHCLERGIKIPSLKKVLMAGAPVPPKLLEDFYACCPNAVALTPYGATECLPITAMDGMEILKETRKLSEEGHGNCVGKALPDIQFKIIECNDDVIYSLDETKEMAEGKIGEIIVNGPIVTDAYDQLPEATRQSKISSPDGVWHRIGDVGYMDGKDRLWFCGRKNHRVITKAGTWHSVNCEAIFDLHPKVFRSALIASPNPKDEGPALVVELFPKIRLNKANLLKELQELAASAQHTRAIETFYIHPAFPVDVRHNAKIHREELAEWAKTAKPLGSY